MIGGPGGAQFNSDLIVEMQITEDEYAQIGKPGINEVVQLDVGKLEGDQSQG
jgi:hypothetical protein